MQDRIGEARQIHLRRCVPQACFIVEVIGLSLQLDQTVLGTAELFQNVERAFRPAERVGHTFRPRLAIEIGQQALHQELFHPMQGFQIRPVRSDDILRSSGAGAFRHQRAVIRKWTLCSIVRRPAVTTRLVIR